MLAQGENEVQRETRLSVDRIIELVRQVRNGLIQDFLSEETARNYFRQQYDKELSQVRAEFLKRDLRELMASPVDLSHYSSLIKLMQETNSAGLTSTNQELFYRELETIFKKYNY